MPWVTGIAELILRVNQGVLAVGLKRNVEIDRGAGRRVNQRHQVGQGGVSRVLCTSVIPKSCKRCREVSNRSDGKYEESKSRHQCILKEVTNC